MLLLLLLAACLAHACSDDVVGVLGNETLAWDAVENATYYEIATNGEVCGSTTATHFLVSGTRCDEINDGSGFVVRACNDVGCSPWSEESVEILPHSCLRGGGNCEEKCYEWEEGLEWRRLPGKYDECP